MTPDQLQQALGLTPVAASMWAGPVTDAMAEFGIDTPVRQAAFLAQVGHESGRMRFVREIWGPTDAQRRYEGRADLGNVMPGDGKKFMGRGLIQVTGRANYNACGIALDLPLCDRPELLEQPINAARSAGWFWRSRNLNQYADSEDFAGLTRRINGGHNGLLDRLALWDSAKDALGVG